MFPGACAGRSYPDSGTRCGRPRSEEHTSELQSLRHLVCRLLLEKKLEVMARSMACARTLGLACNQRLEFATAYTNVAARFFFKSAGAPRNSPSSPPAPFST